MSTRIYQSINLPQDHKAQPATITAAVADALVALGVKIEARGLRVVWDTVEISTEVNVAESVTFDTNPAVRVLTGSASVLAVDPKELHA